MLLMNKDGSFYHSNILDAIDEELTKDFDEKTAAMLRQGIVSRVNHLQENGDDLMEREVNAVYNPIVGTLDTLRDCGIPDDISKEFILHIWSQIPDEKLKEEMRNVLRNK